MDKFDKKSNESHQSETDGSSECNLLKFLSIRLGAFFDEAVGILHELFAWLNVLVDVVHFDPRDGGRVIDHQTPTSWRVRVATINILEALRTGAVDLTPTPGDDSFVRANRLLAAYIRDIIGEEPFTMRRLFGVLT